MITAAYHGNHTREPPVFISNTAGTGTCKSKTVSGIYRMTAPRSILGRSPFNQVWENSSRPLRITSVSNAVPRASSGVPWRKCPTGLGCARVNRRSTLKATCSHNCDSLLSLSLSLTYHLITSLTHSSFSNALFNFLLLHLTSIGFVTKRGTLYILH